MDYLGKDMRKLRKEDNKEEEEKEIKSKMNNLLISSQWILLFSALDEGDIALLKSYVSSFFLRFSFVNLLL